MKMNNVSFVIRSNLQMIYWTITNNSNIVPKWAGVKLGEWVMLP